jgi:hypothetical protein
VKEPLPGVRRDVLECVTEPPKYLILRKIEGRAIMTIEIHQPELEHLIQQRMKSGAFRSVEDFLMQTLITAVPAHDIPPQQPASLSQNPDDRPIWEVITDLMKNVPDEVFDKLPKDGASQVDHYIYGLPKRD